jgi:hypothetical protein
VAHRRRETPSGTQLFADVKKRKPPVKRFTSLLSAWSLRRPADAQAAEYGKLMGAEALRRQWRFDHGRLWDVLRVVERRA